MYPGGRVRIQSLSDPKEVTIKEIGAGQDRPYAAIPLGEGDFAFGSVPGYGQLGGALSIYDGAAKSLDTYAFDKSTTYAPGVNGSLLRDLAPISLAQHGGKIYMGTTNVGFEPECSWPIETQWWQRSFSGKCWWVNGTDHSVCIEISEFMQKT